MSVMPIPGEERAIPRGDVIKVKPGLEIQLAIIEGSEPLDVSAGGHGVMMSVDTSLPGIIVFEKGSYAGHYTLPEDLAEKNLPELLKTDYVQGILDKYKR